jgi:hypothetical protein
MIGLLFALLALVSQPTPRDFVDGFASGHEVVVEGFRGWEWDCGDESCYAGYLEVAGLTTGP